MRGIKAYWFFTVCLMMMGLVGRIIVGSVPFPPLSPFSSPIGSFESQNKNTHYSKNFFSSTESVTKSGKKNGQPKTAGYRQWFGVLQSFTSPKSLRIYHGIDPPLKKCFFNPDLSSSLRPPSC